MEGYHIEIFFIKIELNWRAKNYNDNSHSQFLVESGATGPILNQAWTIKNKIPLISPGESLIITDAGGMKLAGAGETFTSLLTLIIRNHVEELSREIRDLEKGVAGYLPISLLRVYNPSLDSM